MIALALFSACTSKGDGVIPVDTSESGGHVDSDSGRDSGDSGDTGPLPDVDYGLPALDDLGAKNLVLIHVDTLRADRLSPYGSVHDTLPLTNERRWLVVSDHYSVGSWTIPATASLITGRDIPNHGVTHVTTDSVANNGIDYETLAEHLQANGFATFAGSGNSAVQTVEGIANGFDETNTFDSVDSTILMGGLSGLAAEWLDTIPPEQPFFIFLQPMDTHGPYHPGSKISTWSDPDNLPIGVDGDWSEDEQVAAFQAAYQAAATDEERQAVIDMLQNVYDEMVLNIDDGTQHLNALLEERGALDDTLVVFTADHGETVGDDPEAVSFGHGGTTRPELTHIPLMFNHPRLPDQDVECLSQNIDVAPTLVRALGLPPMEDAEGEPLQDGCRQFAHATTYLNNTDSIGTLDMMVTDGSSMLRWSCLRGTSYRYDLTTDPTGQTSLSREETPNIEPLESKIFALNVELQNNLGVPDCAVSE